MPEAFSDLPPGAIAAAVVGLFVLAAIVAWAGRRLLRSWLIAREVADPETRKAVEVRARQLLRGVKLLAYGTAAMVSILPAPCMAVPSSVMNRLNALRFAALSDS